ncbi:MAG: hypothetical protein IPP37_02990 [Saprospiraceae bacterium]|nr:hypothetical protein [Saprospiraceae bacterium]
MSCDYFIFYVRTVETCNELKLLRSCSRGSAVGSITALLFDITKIDPGAEHLISKIYSPATEKLT